MLHEAGPLEQSGITQNDKGHLPKSWQQLHKISHIKGTSYVRPHFKDEKILVGVGWWNGGALRDIQKTAAKETSDGGALYDINEDTCLIVIIRVSITFML